FKKLSAVITENVLTLEVLFVVQKIYLHACSGNGCYFNNKGVIIIVDYNVHSREPDHLVQAVTAFIDIAKPRHQYAYFIPFLLHGLRKLAGNFRNFS